MRPLRIHLLGGFTLYQGEQPPPELPTQKIKSLFAYLTTFRERSHPREVLAELLWGELGADKAKNNLRYALSILRRTFGPYLHIERHQVSFNTKRAYWLDAEEFEKLIVRSRGLRGEARFQTLRQALNLYRGDFLAGFYDDWVLGEQKRLEKLYLEALDALAFWPGGPFLGSPAVGKSEEAGLKRELARSHHNLRDPETALVFGEQALKLYQQTHDPIGQGNAYLTLGIIQRYLGQNAKALDCYQRALALGRQAGDLSIQWRALNDLGWLEWNLGHSQEAQAYYEQALSICQRTGDRWCEAVVLNNWAIAHLDVREYTKALERFDRACEAIAALGNRDLELENLSYRSVAYVGLQMFGKAEHCVGRVLELLEAGFGFRLFCKTHLNLWWVLRAVGRPDEARRHLQLAYDDVRTRAQKIRGATLQESFWKSDRTNREILEAWKVINAP